MGKKIVKYTITMISRIQRFITMYIKYVLQPTLLFVSILKCLPVQFFIYSQNRYLLGQSTF